MAEISKLLSQKEKNICNKISKLKSIEGKRAKALLYLDGGDTQVNAAKKSGLTYGQVKYFLTIFRKKRMDIFQAANIEKAEKPKKKQKKSKKLKPEVKDKKSKKKEKKDKKKKKDKTKSKTKKKKKTEKKKTRKSNK